MSEEPAAPAVRNLKISDARIIDPDSSNRTEVRDAEKVFDGDQDEGWSTETYNRSKFGNLKRGMGVWIDLGTERTVKSVQVNLSDRGASAELLTGTTNAPSSSSGDDEVLTAYLKNKIGQPFEEHDGTTMTFDGFDADKKYRYLLFWITELRRTVAVSRSGCRRSRSRVHETSARRLPPGRVMEVRDAGRDHTGAASVEDTVSDLDLLRAHVSGDRDAFGELFRRHRDRLWAVALRTLGDREEAADALQDALLSAHRAAGRFRGDSAVTTWLHRIVVNACLDRIRRRRAHPTCRCPTGCTARRMVRPPAAWSRPHRYPTTTPRWSSGTPGRVASRAAGRPRTGGRAGLPGRRGRADPGRRRGDGQESLRSGPCPARGHARPPAAGAGPAGASRPDVPDVTGGNPKEPSGVRSGSGRSRPTANQQEEA